MRAIPLELQPMPTGDGRRLWLAAALSLALHGGVMAAFSHPARLDAESWPENSIEVEVVQTALPQARPDATDAAPMVVEREAESRNPDAPGAAARDEAQSAPPVASAEPAAPQPSAPEQARRPSADPTALADTLPDAAAPPPAGEAPPAIADARALPLDAPPPFSEAGPLDAAPLAALDANADRDARGEATAPINPTTTTRGAAGIQTDGDARESRRQAERQTERTAKRRAQRQAEREADWQEERDAAIREKRDVARQAAVREAASRSAAREAARQSAERQSAARQRAAAARPSGTDVAAFRAAVASRVAAQKRYPAGARERGDVGRPVVAFAVTQGGGLGGVSLSRSSGHRDLDAEALAMVRRAAPFPPPPVGAPRAFSIGVSFDLR